MFRNATPQKAITFTRRVVFLTYCWPLPLTATRFQIIRFKIFRSLVFLNIFVLIFPLLYSMHLHRDDPDSVAKSACACMSFAKDLIQTVFCVRQYRNFQDDPLQKLIAEMVDFCENAEHFERQILQQYIEKYALFYGLAGSWFFVTASVFIFGTLMTSEPFPTNAEYPFSVDFEPLRSIIFIHQALAYLEIASHVCVGIFCALIMLTAAARLECLMAELRAVRDFLELVQCIKKYRVVRRYAVEVSGAFKFIVVISVGTCAIAAVLCGISFIGKTPLVVKVQFLFVALCAFLEVFMCAWPADHLIDASLNVAQGAYESMWYEQPIKLQKTVQIILLPLRPVAISVKCFISVFSLNYYCTFISNVFSLFTALRVALMAEEEN